MVRFKSRYLVLELYSIDSKKGMIPYQAPSPIPTTSSFANQLRSHLAAHFGQYGVALSNQSLSVKYLNAQTGTVIIRTARDQLPVVWATITLMGTEKFGNRVVAVSGTIRKAQRAAIRHIITELRRMAMGGTDAKKQLKDAITSCEKAISILDA